MIPNVPDSYEATIQLVGQACEAAGIVAILLGFIVATIRAALHVSNDDAYLQYRRRLGRALLLGLELLVAGDIIRTVTTSPSLVSAIVLAIIVLVRTFLSFSIELEVEGRWPWQRTRATDGAPRER